MLKRRGGCSQGFADAKPNSYMLFDATLKTSGGGYRKKGGACSQSLADAKVDNYMLLNDALKTGGAKKRSSKKNTKKHTYSRSKKYGGVETTTPPTTTTAQPPTTTTTAQPTTTTAQAPATTSQAPAASMTLMDTLKPPINTFGMGSAFSGLLPVKGGNKQAKKGGTGVELAPFISSLVLLGLRIGTDKGLQESVTKNISSMVSKKDKLSSKKTTSKKTTSKKTTSKKTTSRKMSMR